VETPASSDHAAKPARWTFLSNHAHVLICIAQEPDIRLREIAARVGITERAASGIVADLDADGYLTRVKEGRNNTYRLNTSLALRHPIERHRAIGDLLQIFEDPPSTK
jgi:predicted transcriptional regulator